MKRVRQAVGWLVSVLPLIALFILMGFAIMAWQRVGHWPMYSRPDPKELQQPVLHAASILAYPISLLAIVAGLIIVMGAPRFWSRAQCATFISGAVAWAVSMPQAGRLLNWLLD